MHLSFCFVFLLQLLATVYCARPPKKPEQCDLSTSKLRTKSCRWDTKSYFNKKVVPQPRAHVCNGLAIAAAIELAHAIHDRTKYDLSIQAILDCFVPTKCFPSSTNPDGSGCTARDILKDIETQEVKHRKRPNEPPSPNKAPGSYGIFLHQKDYKHPFNPTITQHLPCVALQTKAKWALNAIEHELAPPKASLQQMMIMLRKSPFIAIIKVTDKFASYKITSGQLEQLQHAFNADAPGQKPLGTHHAILVHGYINDEKHKQVYFRVKTWKCSPGNRDKWGSGGYGYIKLGKPNSLEFNAQLYTVKAEKP